jgi:hypothetical protein
MSGSGVVVVAIVVVAVAVAVLEAGHSAVARFEWFEAIVDEWEADNQEEEESRCFAVVRED